MGESGRGLLVILKYIHPRHVIWVLLVALMALLAFIGKEYDKRLEAVEIHKKEQNGHLQHMREDFRELKTDIKWIKLKLEDR